MPHLSVRTRFEIFKRDRFTCAYCGRTPPDVVLEADHIIPRAAGGSDEIDNLITACWECNHGKSDRLLEEGIAPAVSQRAVDEASERVSQATAYAEAVRMARELDGKFRDMVIEAWADAFGAVLHETKDGTYWQFGHGGRFPSEASIRRILRRLPVVDMLEAVDIAASKFRVPNADAERYFFGTCWRKLTERESGQ